MINTTYKLWSGNHDLNLTLQNIKEVIRVVRFEFNILL